MTFPRVVGLGSHQGDDQAGWLVIDELEKLGYPRSRLLKIAHPVDLLDDISPSSALVICDACQGQGMGGTIHHWQWPTDSFIARHAGGTHDLPLPQVLDLARQLARCPDRVDIWAIAGTSWSGASEPGPAVQTAARNLASKLWDRRHA